MRYLPTVGSAAFSGRIKRTRCPFFLERASHYAKDRISHPSLSSSFPAELWLCPTAGPQDLFSRQIRTLRELHDRAAACTRMGNERPIHFAAGNQRPDDCRVARTVLPAERENRLARNHILHPHLFVEAATDDARTIGTEYHAGNRTALQVLVEPKLSLR